ncbi:hypothetical protein DL93DRAFT_1073242 [Clavulina sp. PMI_390]|nr:hypothetical protein DL93DRAFT_1073242 [Clavulina sp. PMI_390]
MQGKYSKLDPKSRQELETQRIKEKREQEEVGSRLKKFSESLGQQHGKELDAVREEKADNLKKRLIATGIREDIVKAVPQNDWRKYPTMLVSKPLTDTAWGKIRVAAEKKLQDTIQRIKILATEGVGRALAAQYRTEFQPLDHSVFRPRFELLLHSTVLINAVSPYLEEHYFEIFQKMLVTSRDGFSWEYFTSFKEFDQHQNQRVTAVTQYLASLGLTLQGLPIAEAISDMEQHIQSPFLREMPNPNPEPSALNLATSLFHRRIAIREDRGLPWLNCLRTSTLSAKIKFPSPLDPTAPLPQLLACDIKFDSIASSITARIISACGLDPNTCTHEQLETLNPMVACAKCSDGPEASKYRLTMPWDEAYPHWADEHSSMPPEASEWAILDDEQSATFIKHLEKQPVKRDEYYCTLCELKPEESTLSIFSSYLGTTTPNDGLSLTRLKTHLRTTHKLPPATAEQSQYHQKLRPFGRLHPIMWNASTKSSKVRTTPSWWDDKQPWKDPSISYGHPLSFLFDDMYSDDDDDMYPGGLPFYDDYDGFYSDEGPMFGYDPDDFW